MARQKWEALKFAFQTRAQKDTRTRRDILNENMVITKGEFSRDIKTSFWTRTSQSEFVHDVGAVELSMASARRSTTDIALSGTQYLLCAAEKDQ